MNWGAGRGFARVEFAAFGVPPEESASRFREAVEIVLRAWTDERLNYAGQHFRFEDLEVLPKPAQQPHPPVWMAASSEGAIEWAASQGFPILMDPHSSAAEIGRKRRFYAEKLAAAGLTEVGRDIPIARLVALADDPSKAAAVARRRQRRATLRGGTREDRVARPSRGRRLGRRDRRRARSRDLRLPHRREAEPHAAEPDQIRWSARVPRRSIDRGLAPRALAPASERLDRLGARERRHARAAVHRTGTRRVNSKLKRPRNPGRFGTGDWRESRNSPRCGQSRQCSHRHYPRGKDPEFVEGPVRWRPGRGSDPCR